MDYIIIDGASTDGTLGILEEYRSAVTTLISERDEGISDAFNKGIRLASGDVIGFVSADDWLPVGALQRLAEGVERYPGADVYYGDAEYQEEGNPKLHVVQPDCDLSKICWRQPLKHAATWVAADAYRRFGVFDLTYRYAMDYELVLRFHRSGARFCRIEGVLGAFRGGGVNNVRFRETLREVRDASVAHGCPIGVAEAAYRLKIARVALRKCLIDAGAWPLLNAYRRASGRFRLGES